MDIRSACLCGLLLCVSLTFCQKITNESWARQWLEEINPMISQASRNNSIAQWAQATNITKANSDNALKVKSAYLKVATEIGVVASAFDSRAFNDTLLQRMFDLYQAWAPAETTPDKKNGAIIQQRMENIYGTAKIPLKGKSIPLDPDLTNIMSRSEDYDDLKYVWKAWRDATGKKMRSDYIDYTIALDESAKNNGYPDRATVLQKSYESETFEKDMEAVYNQLKPFYSLLHGYVKGKLANKYGDKYFPKNLIPAHILGNMWAQSWSSLTPRLLPYPNALKMDVTSEMVKQNYTALKMFKLSADFFSSLGLKNMTEEFWENSMIVKPNDGREVQCHASAWDFSDGKDFRIKQCTDVTMNDLLTVHHEMGHIQYYIEYAHLNYVLRRGANPGFHEAIGDAITLSVVTPQHMKSIGLLKNYSNSNESTINFLMEMALEKIAFLPFGYLMDKYRWELYRSKNISSYQLNKRWWDMRCQYQGVFPPVRRTEQDFDAGSKYHIPADVPYIRYFFSHIFQFQLHKAMCDAANHKGPLYECDVYKSKEAGDVMRAGLSLGRSQPWPQVMMKMTGQSRLNASALFEFYQPLITWLEKNVPKDDRTWSNSCPDDSFYIENKAVNLSHNLSCVFLLYTVVMYLNKLLA